MKRIIFTLLISAAAFVACDNGLPDEMFEKKVVITQNGFLKYPLDYTNAANSISDTIISLAVSGTSRLSRDVTVNLKIDTDTLRGYNWEKFRSNEALYYEELPSNCYEMELTGFVIKAGSEYANVPIRFFLDNFDKEKNYILPIAIESVSEYVIGDADYSKVLMNTKLQNEHSGTYNLSAKAREENDSELLDVKLVRELSVYNRNTCYFYAGNIAENNPNRDTYKVYMEILSDSTLVFTPDNPNMVMQADTPDLDIENPKNRVSRSVTRDVNNKRRYTIVTTFYINYWYTDLSIPDEPVKVRMDGTMMRTKVIYN